MYGIHDQAIDLLHHSYNTHIYITIKKQDCFADKLSDVEQWRNYGGGDKKYLHEIFSPCCPPYEISKTYIFYMLNNKVLFR